MRASPCLRTSVGALLLTFSFAAMSENAVTTDVASVRAGPDSSYPEVAQLDADTPIQVMGCVEDWSWCDVAFGGDRGWLYSPDITYEYEGGYVPLYSYAPALGVAVVPFTLDVYWGSYYHNRPWYGERERWSQRTFHHQLPPGPRPSASPPPRQLVRMERPHAGSQPDRPMRLGNAEPAHRDAEPSHRDAIRHDEAAAHVEAPAAEPRTQAHFPPPTQRPELTQRPEPVQRAESAQRPEPARRPEPAQHADPRSARPEGAAHQGDDAHSRSSAHAETQPHEEQQRREPDRPEGPPRKD